MCSMARLYGRVLKRRIEDQFAESEEQNEIRTERLCIDGTFTLRIGTVRALYSNIKHSINR